MILPKDRFALFISIFQSRLALSLGTLFLVLLTSTLEGIGLSLLFPIFRVVLQGIPGSVAAWFPGLAQLNENELLIVLCSGFILAVAAKTLFSIVRFHLSRRLAWSLRIEWMKTIFHGFVTSHFAQVGLQRQGERLSVLTTETHRAAICISQLCELVARILLFAVLYAICLFSYWQVTLLVSLVVLVCLPCIYLLKRYASKVGRRRVELAKQLSTTASEGFAGLRQIKTFGLEGKFDDLFSEACDRLYATELRFETLRVLPVRGAELIGAVLMIGVVVYLKLCTSYDFEINGTALIVLGYIGLRLLSNALDISSLYVQLLALVPSVETVHAQIQGQAVGEETDRGKQFPGLCNHVVLENVCFSYVEGKSVLDGMDIEIAKGQTVAFIGDSGIGKSTVADLLLGFYTPQKGRILVDGKCLSEYSLCSWRQHIGYVTQDTSLFNLTIRENIALGCYWGDVSDEEIIGAAKLAHAHDFILQLPQGYDTPVGERGDNLSGGQRQRIAIARALVRDPDILIFDEATSSLDAESERNIKETIAELGTEKTVIVIAHRSAVIEEADRVYDLNKMQDNTRPTSD